jgi:hypothetical protein
VITVERQGSHYYFRVRPFEPAHGTNPHSNSSLPFTEHHLHFNSNASATSFLRHFASNPFAVQRFQILLVTLGVEAGFHGIAEHWVDRLAPQLANGRVTVIERVTLAPAGESTQGGKSAAQTTPPPRRKDTSSPPVEQPDAPTFADSDEDAQVQTLVQAAQSGAPFCEACARAAAARSQASNAQQQQTA